jgi:predicted dehydrogenase
VRLGFKRAERAGIRVDFGREGLAWAERGTRRQVLARNPRHATARATTALYAATMEAWRRGAQAPTDGQRVRDTLSVVDAAYRSSETGAGTPLAGG